MHKLERHQSVQCVWAVQALLLSAKKEQFVQQAQQQLRSLVIDTSMCPSENTGMELKKQAQQRRHGGGGRRDGIGHNRKFLLLSLPTS